MKRQLLFLFLAVLLILSKVAGFIGWGWLVAGLCVLFLLWYPLRFGATFQVSGDITATCYWLPAPGVKIKLLTFQRPAGWWKDLLSGVENLRQKKQAKQAKEEETTEAADKPSRVTPELIDRALAALSFERVECSLELGGSPMLAALAAGSIHMVLGWAIGVLSYRVASFPEPKIQVGMEPEGPLLAGEGTLQVRTDLTALCGVGIFFVKEWLRRKKDGGKRNRKLAGNSHGEFASDGRCQYSGGNHDDSGR